MISAREVRENYARVKARLTQAARKAGREPEEVNLVVVTKGQPVEVVHMAIEAGARYLGENYLEEAIEKRLALSPQAGVEWHMIGHVQSRKARGVCEHFDFLHSLDSLKLARRLDGFAKEFNRMLPVLLEFNVSGEASKSGWRAWEETCWDDLLPDLEQVMALPHLQVRGLMTMPPFLDHAEQARPFFSRLRRLQAYLTGCFPDRAWTELSMGMSADYEIAIQEGATWVRIGQAILGFRPTLPRT